MNILKPADASILGAPAPVIAFIILFLSVSFFCYVMFRRMDVLRKAAPDPRFSNIPTRLMRSLIYGFGQWRQPRYLGAGILHILLFAGFMILSLRSLTLIGRGFSSTFHIPFLTGSVGFAYESLKDYTVIVVLTVCLIAIVRRAVFHPKRYDHPGIAGHEYEAYIILGLVSALMITDMIHDGSAYRASRGLRRIPLVPCGGLCLCLHALQRPDHPQLPPCRRLLGSHSVFFRFAELPPDIQALPCYYSNTQRFLFKFEQGDDQARQVWSC